jgi:hypothetical protein
MGLIKTGLKAAVAVKTAHYVHDRIEKRQQAQWAASQGQQSAGAGPAAPPQAGQSPVYGAVEHGPPVVAATPATLSAPAGQDRTAVLSQLKELGELKASGVLTEEEFVQQKTLILGG